MIKRVGEPPLRGIRYGRRPGAYAILLRGDEILLTHQQEPEPEFQLPGGGIDPGESPVHALHREVREETGWTIAKPRRIGAFRRFVYMPEYERWAEKVCHIFVARPARALGPPTEAGHTAVWTPARLAPEMVENPGDAGFIRRLIGELRA